MSLDIQNGTRSPKKEKSPAKMNEPINYADQQSQNTKYTNLAEQTINAPDGIILQQSNQSSNKKYSDLGLIDENEEDEEDEAQTKHVEMDLFKGIMGMAKSKQLAAIGGLLGAFCIHLIVGAIYRWNMITGYVGTFYDINDWTPVGAPLSMFCVGVTMRLGYNLSGDKGSLSIMLFAMFVIGASTMTASYMPNFPMFLLFHNVVYGLCAGLLFLPSLKECHKFFPKMKLLTNSIILTGTGLGAVLFGALNIECIEYQNYDYSLSDTELQRIVDENFEVCFFKMGFIVWGIGFIGISMMIPMILRNQEKDRLERNLSIEERGNFCKTELEAFKSRVFWVIGIIIFLCSCGNYYIIMNFKSLLAAQHQKKLYLYWILISGALGNGLPRIIWGFIFSRIGFKILFLAAATINLASFTTIMATDDQTAYLIFYTLNSISLGGMMVIIPNLCLLVFGKKIGEIIYSYYWMIFSLSNFFQFSITLLLTQNPTTSDDYGEVLIVFFILVLCSIFVCYRQRLQGPWKNSLNLIQMKGKDLKSNSYK